MSIRITLEKCSHLGTPSKNNINKVTSKVYALGIAKFTCDVTFVLLKKNDRARRGVKMIFFSFLQFELRGGKSLEHFYSFLSWLLLTEKTTHRARFHHSLFLNFATLLFSLRYMCVNDKSWYRRTNRKTFYGVVILWLNKIMPRWTKPKNCLVFHQNTNQYINNWKAFLGWF